MLFHVRPHQGIKQRVTTNRKDRAMKRIALVVVLGLLAWLAVEQTTAQPIKEPDRLCRQPAELATAPMYEAQHRQAASRTGPRAWQYTLVTRLDFPATKKAMWAVTGTATFKLGDEVKVPEMLNRCGAEGWDLVTFTESGSDGMRATTFYFKRLVP